MSNANVARFNRRISFTIGLTSKSGAPLVPTDALVTAAAVLAVEGIDSFSVVWGAGFWKGSLEENVTLSVLVNANLPEGVALCSKADDIAGVLAAKLDQECVLWTTESVIGGLSFS